MDTKQPVVETKPTVKENPKVTKGKVSFGSTYPNHSLVVVPASYNVENAVLALPPALEPKVNFEWIDFYYTPVEKELVAGDYYVAIVDLSSPTNLGEWKKVTVEADKSKLFFY